jgi:hypothetical protein
VAGKSDPYLDGLKKDFGQIVDGLDLDALQKRFLKSR